MEQALTSHSSRPILLVGGSLMSVFLYIVGAISSVSAPPRAAQVTMVSPARFCRVRSKLTDNL
jgi:hypothetical protein